MLTLYSFSRLVLLEEGVHGGRVEVVLVLGGLLGLRLDQERALEADLVLVLGHEREEAAELVELLLHVGVEQRLVPFPAAPEHVVLAAEPVRRLEDLGDLRRRVGKHLGIGVRRRARQVTSMAEEVGRAPQELDAGALHLALHAFEDAVEVRVALPERGPLGRDVAIVEGEVGRTELLEEFECSLQLLSSSLEGVARAVPRPLEGLLTESVATLPGKGMPVADSRPKLSLHALPQHQTASVVVAVRERILRLGALEFDGRDASKIALGHGSGSKG